MPPLFSTYTKDEKMLRLNRKGFTLIEIIVVVIIIAILASLAIPNFLKVRVKAQESTACASIHTIYTGEIAYRAVNPQFATLAQLGGVSPPYIDSALAAGTKQGYTFVAIPGAAGANFYVTAVHTAGQGRSFYIDEDGITCRSVARGVAAISAHYNGAGCPSGYILVE